MTKVDFRPILTDDEYVVFGNFLSNHVIPNGERTIRYNCNTKRYNTMILSVNTYDKEHLLEKAEERLASPRASITGKETLTKVIEYIRSVT